MEKEYNEKMFNEKMSCKKSILIVNIENKFIVHKRNDDKWDMYDFIIWDDTIQQYEFSCCTIPDFCLGHLNNAKLQRSFATKSIELTPNGIRVIKHENNN